MCVHSILIQLLDEVRNLDVNKFMEIKIKRLNFGDDY